MSWMTPTASEIITATVTAWPGVEAGHGERGEFGFRVGRREIGHLHGDRVAHFAFPKQLRAELLEQGRIVPHPVASPGLGARRIADDSDIDEVIALMRLNYERTVDRHGVSGGAPAA
jgi:Family of unknown function (DUF5519)